MNIKKITIGLALIAMIMIPASMQLAAGENEGIADKVTTEMIEALKRRGRFKVLDRRDLDIIIDEQKMSAADFSSLRGAEIVVTGRIWDEDLSLQIEAKAIEIKTGRVIMIKRIEKKKYPGILKRGVEYSSWFLKEIGSLIAYIAGAFVRGFLEASH